MTTGGSRSNRVEYEVFWGEIGAVKKKKKNTRSILSFHTSIFNQGGANRYVLRLIEWQNLKRKIVAVFIFWTANIFEDKLKRGEKEGLF